MIELKPDTLSVDDARRQADRYVDDVRRRFKDDRAKKCKRDADGYPLFKSVGVTYQACWS